MKDDNKRKFPKSSERNKFPDDLDPLTLYVTHIPLDFNRDFLRALMAGQNRNVKKLMLNNKLNANSLYTFAFVHFATHEEALSALNELNNKPPWCMQICFSYKKVETNDKAKSTSEESLPFSSRGRGRGMSPSANPMSVDSNFGNHQSHSHSSGRGMHINSEGSQPNVNSNFGNALPRSLGRGVRIDLEGSQSISRPIKVTTSTEGRKVMVKESPQKPVHASTEQLVLAPNPFYFCFACGKEGLFSCKICRKPYCSKNCVESDLVNHRKFCKQAKGIADSLLSLFKNSALHNNDSSYVSEENSGSDHEKAEITPGKSIKSPSTTKNVEMSKPVQKLASPGQPIEKLVSPGQPIEKLVSPPKQTAEKLVQCSEQQIETIVLFPGQQELVSVINIESPSKFWIRLKKFSRDFSKMESELRGLQKVLTSINTPNPNGLVCCTLYGNGICRAKVLKAKTPNELLVHLIDHGKIVSAQKSNLYNLPNEFRTLPAQAVCCCLVENESGNCNMQWNSNDTQLFQIHTLDKMFKAFFQKLCNSTYYVSLINKEGINIYSLLDESSSRTVPQAPSENPVPQAPPEKPVPQAPSKKPVPQAPSKKPVPQASPKKSVPQVPSKKPVPQASSKMSAPKTSFEKSTPQASEIDGPPPSVWSKLKPGNKMTLVQSIVSENFAWCYLLTDRESDPNVIAETEKLLQNYSGKDISKSVEEGDFAAGFSNEYGQHYRCFILKRKRESFLVRYIDYGNEEEISQLSSLSPELYQKCCFLVKCQNPSPLSMKDFEKFLSTSGEVVLQKIDGTAAQLSFDFGKKCSIICYPCYPINGSEDVSADNCMPSVSNNNIDSVLKSATPVHPTKSDCKAMSRESPKAAVDYKEVAKKIIVPKVLSLSKKYSVKITFMKDVSELYVILTEDELKMTKMVQSLNSLCNSRNVCHVPSVGEIVSCKFSDGVWYRGKVLQKIDSGYRIFFIDYGNEDVVKKDDVQDLTDKYVCPQFSICVSLGKVKKEDIASLLTKFQEETWEMRVIDNKQIPVEVMLSLKGRPLTEMIPSKRTKSLLKFQKLLLKSTVKICFADEKYLYVNQVKDLKALEELSGKLNSMSGLPVPEKPMLNNVYCGLFTDGLWYRVSVEEELSPSNYKVNFLDFGNTETVSAKDLRELPNELFALPVYCTPISALNREALNLTMEDEYSVEVVDEEGDVQSVKFAISKIDTTVETKRSPKNKSSLIFKTLPANEQTEIKICFIDSKCVYLHQVKDLQVVEDLIVKVNTLPDLPVLDIKPALNNVYCGLFSDGLWYRVSVEEAVSSDSYKVFFLDYGNYETVSSNNLRELPDDLFSIPVCCIPVIVEGKDHTTFSLEKQYTVQATGMHGNIQKVKLILPKEEQKLPQISSMKKQKLGDGLNEVVFCHMEGSVVYCQLSSDNEKVLGMYKTLQQCGREGRSPESVSTGDVVCAQSSDNMWYRANIISDKKAPSYKVMFLDYGNKEDITKDCIKILPGELVQLPIFAIPLKIRNMDEIKDTSLFTKNVMVKNITLENDISLVDVVDDEVSSLKASSLKSLTVPCNDVTSVTFCHLENDLYFVQLTAEADNIEKLQSQLTQADTFDPLLNSPEVDDVVCAKYSDGNWYRCIVLEVNETQIKVSFMDYGNSDFVPRENLKILPLELSSYPVFSVPVKFKDNAAVLDYLSKEITTFNVKVCDLDDGVQVVDLVSESSAVKPSKSNPDSSCDSTDALPLAKSPPLLANKKENSKKFMFTSCKSVEFNNGEQDIAIYNVDEDGYLFCAPFNFQNIEANLSLPSLLTEHCNSKGIPFDDCEPELGEMVIALYSVDSNWYRATIIDKAHPVYDVSFVDYGNIERLNISQLRKMEDQFMELEVQAHMCSLSGFTVPDENVSSVYDALKRFIVFEHPQPLKANIQITEGDITADIPEITSCLVEKNLVVLNQK